MRVTLLRQHHLRLRRVSKSLKTKKLWSIVKLLCFTGGVNWKMIQDNTEVAYLATTWGLNNLLFPVPPMKALDLFLPFTVKLLERNIWTHCFQFPSSPSHLQPLHQAALISVRLLLPHPKHLQCSMLPTDAQVCLCLIQPISRTLHSWSHPLSGFQNPHFFSPLTVHSSSVVSDPGSPSFPPPLHTEVTQFLDFVLVILPLSWMWAPCGLFPVYPVCSLHPKHICWCEMKIFPAILINKKCNSHQRFLASQCEWGLPKQPSSGCCHPHSDCWGAGGKQEAR